VTFQPPVLAFNQRDLYFFGLRHDLFSVSLVYSSSTLELLPSLGEDFLNFLAALCCDRLR
jgi:hypothetical protein